MQLKNMSLDPRRSAGTSLTLCISTAILCLTASYAPNSLADKAKTIPTTVKLDTFYADPTAPNIAGVWQEVRDGYRPIMASEFQLMSGMKLGTATDNGLPPGVLPLDTWIVDGKPLPGHSPGGPWLGIPYTPKWEAVYQKRIQDNRDGKVHGDPHFDCLPRGAMSNYHGGPRNMAITQTAGKVQQVFFNEQTVLRNFYTDGRKHPSWTDVASEDYDPTPHGHSIGHWEGNTLVVDTVGVDKNYTLGYLAPHSDVFHMVERFTRLNDKELSVDLVVDDKKALLKPMLIKFRYRLAAAQYYKEETCTNNRNITDEDGYVQTLLRPKKSAGWDLPEDD